MHSLGALLKCLRSIVIIYLTHSLRAELPVSLVYEQGLLPRASYCIVQNCWSLSNWLS